MLCYNAKKQTSHNLMINVHSIVVYCEMQLQLVWYVHRCPKELTGQSCCLTLSCVFTGAPRSSQDRAVVSPCLVCSQVPQGAHRTELLSHLVLCVHRCPKELTGQSCCLTLSCVFTGAPRSSQDRAVVSRCLVCSQVPQGAHRTELLSHLVLCVHRCPKELTGQSCCLTLSCVFTGAPRSSQDRAVVSPCLVCSQVPQGAHRTELLSHLVLCVHRCPKELTGQSCCLTLSCVFTGAPRSSQDRAVVSPCLVCSQVPQGAHRTELLSHLVLCVHRCHKELTGQSCCLTLSCVFTGAPRSSQDRAVVPPGPTAYILPTTHVHHQVSHSWQSCHLQQGNAIK